MEINPLQILWQGAQQRHPHSGPKIPGATGGGHRKIASRDRLRTISRTAIYRVGILRLLHNVRNRECLTVIMFHRVLPGYAFDLDSADPEYTVTPEQLRFAVNFFRVHYSLVSAEDVLRSLRRERPLPDYPLLITFDDGWRDNLRWAEPELRDTPWTLFVATEAISQRGWWWQEVVLVSLRRGQTTHNALLTAIDNLDIDDREDTLNLLIKFSELSSEQRFQEIAKLKRRFSIVGSENQMLSWDELHELKSKGVTIGSHGASHLPLSALADPHKDLERSVKALNGLASGGVLSFPHGRYSPKVVKAARECGFKALFTSDRVLNPCPDGWLKSDIIGRIPLESKMIVDRQGKLAPHVLASNLFLRNIIELRGTG